MQGSKFSRLFAVAVAGFAIAAAVAVAAFSAINNQVAEAIARTGQIVKQFVLGGFELAANKAVADRKPSVWFVQAKAFVLRLAKRHRPEVSGSWRMCPST